MRRACLLLLLCLAFTPAVEAHHDPRTKSKSSSTTLPVTTSSVKARDLYQRAMADYENLYLERCNVGWRAAAKEDPNFALAHAMIALNSRDPQEVLAERDKAKALAAKVTPGEKLMIHWIASVQEGNFMNGIAAMNDMLDMFPKDKQIYFIAANWLMVENGNEHAQTLLEQALAIDKNYPAALNDLAYIHARNRQFDVAFDEMERYVHLLPTEPNPQDSYAEVLRMAGNFDAALEHYRAALKIDPDFVTSQLGLGDTYALMGDQSRARVEYEKAIQQAHTPADRLDYTMQKAVTWVREKNFEEADKAFFAIAQAAHAQELPMEEAQAYARMAEYQIDDAKALKRLDDAEDALFHNALVSQSERDEQLSRILRWRVMRASHAGQTDLAGEALTELQTIAEGNRNRVLQASYHGAAGAMFMQNEKFTEAIAELQEDTDDPGSLELLAHAYAATGVTDKQHEVESRLKATFVPTMEQALVVPAVSQHGALVKPTL
jgi:tetratricopeptide (TPR) repeat protein